MDLFSTQNTAQYRSEQSEIGTYKSVQAWKKPKNIAPEISGFNAQNTILGNLERAANGKIGSFDVHLESANAYAQNTANNQRNNQENHFGFGDMVDIINPLQHIPLVNMAYREITGDNIHPISQIIGGALYGGPVGALTGTANAIAKVQTGKDIGDHALAFVGLGSKANTLQPETQLNLVAEKLENRTPLEDLPGSALAFVNMAEPRKSPLTYERVQIAEGRTAGAMAVKKNWASRNITNAVPSEPVNNKNLPARQKITALSVSAMPLRSKI